MTFLGGLIASLVGCNDVIESGFGDVMNWVWRCQRLLGEVGDVISWV